MLMRCRGDTMFALGRELYWYGSQRGGRNEKRAGQNQRRAGRKRLHTIGLGPERLERRLMLSLASIPDQPFPTGVGPLAVATGLVDSDERTDAIVLNSDGKITVALN